MVNSAQPIHTRNPKARSVRPFLVDLRIPTLYKEMLSGKEESWVVRILFFSLLGLSRLAFSSSFLSACVPVVLLLSRWRQKLMHPYIIIDHSDICDVILGWWQKKNRKKRLKYPCLIIIVSIWRFMFFRNKYSSHTCNQFINHLNNLYPKYIIIILLRGSFLCTSRGFIASSATKISQGSRPHQPSHHTHTAVMPLFLTNCSS